MILGKEDIDRVRRLEGVMSRLLEAHRWLSEFDDALEPFWAYVFGRRITQIIDEKGRTLERMSESDISAVREKLRKRLGPDSEGSE